MTTTVTTECKDVAAAAAAKAAANNYNDDDDNNTGSVEHTTNTNTRDDNNANNNANNNNNNNTTRTRFEQKGLVACTSSFFRSTVLSKIRALYRFPSQSIPITTSIVQRTLSAYPHLIVVLERACPRLMFLTRFNGLKMVVFIEVPVSPADETRVEMHATTGIRFSNELYNDTLFEGEFDADVTAFKIVDVLGINEQYLDKINLVRRLQLIHRMLQSGYMATKKQQIAIATAKYYEYPDMWRAARDADGARGAKKAVVFKSMHLKFSNYVFSTSTVFHPPPPVLESLVVASASTSSGGCGGGGGGGGGGDRERERRVDAEGEEGTMPQFPVEHGSVRSFWIARMPRPDTYALYEGERDACSNQVAAINTMQISSWMRQMFSRTSEERLRMQCVYNKNMRRWIPVPPPTNEPGRPMQPTPTPPTPPTPPRHGGRCVGCIGGVLVA